MQFLSVFVALIALCACTAKTASKKPTTDNKLATTSQSNISTSYTGSVPTEGGEIEIVEYQWIIAFQASSFPENSYITISANSTPRLDNQEGLVSVDDQYDIVITNQQGETVPQSSPYTIEITRKKEDIAAIVGNDFTPENLAIFSWSNNQYSLIIPKNIVVDDDTLKIIFEIITNPISIRAVYRNGSEISDDIQIEDQSSNSTGNDGQDNADDDNDDNTGNNEDDEEEDENEGGGGSAPGSFNITPPANPETTVRPEIVWTASSSANSYEIRVSSAENCSGDVIITTSSLTSYTLPILYQGSYFICIIAQNDNGNTSVGPLPININPVIASSRIAAVYYRFASDINFATINYVEGQASNWDRHVFTADENKSYGIGNSSTSLFINDEEKRYIGMTRYAGATGSHLRTMSSVDGISWPASTAIELPNNGTSYIQFAGLPHDIIAFPDATPTDFILQYHYDYEDPPTSTPRIKELRDYSSSSVSNYTWDVNINPSALFLELDRENNVHNVIYQINSFTSERHIIYRKLSSGIWSDFESADIGCAPDALYGLQIDSQNRPHILFRCPGGEIYYSYRLNSGTWYTPLFIEDNNNLATLAFALDKNDSLHIVSLSTSMNGGLFYYTNASGHDLSDKKVIGNLSGSDISLTVDSKGITHIVYISTTGVYLIYGVPGNWESSSIDSLSGGDSARDLARRIYALE